MVQSVLDYLEFSLHVGIIFFLPVTNSFDEHIDNITNNFRYYGYLGYIDYYDKCGSCILEMQLLAPQSYKPVYPPYSYYWAETKKKVKLSLCLTN
jgi:hypothetical protein